MLFLLRTLNLHLLFSRWLSWLKFECGFYPKRIMIDCSVTEMDAILSTFGTEVQVLVCHWHIRRAWEKKLNRYVTNLNNFYLYTYTTSEKEGCDPRFLSVHISSVDLGWKLTIHLKSTEPTRTDENRR